MVKVSSHVAFSIGISHHWTSIWDKIFPLIVTFGSQDVERFPSTSNSTLKVLWQLLQNMVISVADFSKEMWNTGGMQEELAVEVCRVLLQWTQQPEMDHSSGVLVLR